jgi:hypothetical protein
MRKIMLAFAGAAALTAASAANAAITIGAGSQISINGSVITNTADASQATALDFTSGTTTNGSLPGNLSQFNGGATGSFAGQFCTGTCGTINDIASLAVGPLSPALSPFFTLTDGVTFSLNNITTIDRSVAGILGFVGTGTFGGTLGGVALNPAPGNFSFSTQGGNVTTFSATTTATTAVPEPVTWALMLLGFGGMGMALRRRRGPALAQVA